TTYLTQAAIAAQNVSELTAEESMNYITAAIQQFKLEAKDAMSVVDKWNEVNCLPPHTVMCA
ncbi:phage tail tape measure protein, partial [Mycobacterium tuberculosis]|uniref:phage tail tape measure protein n=1 Tax=Mycobacterium tuberculosis TaxID=1773 RepID=UPI0009319228